MIHFFLFIILVSLSFGSTSLVIERHSSKGGEQKAIFFEEKNLKVIQNTNGYDDQNDYRLGVLLGKKSNDLFKTQQRLQQISIVLKEAERILAKSKTTFKKLDNLNNPHGDKIYLDKILVSEDSSYYQELKQIITSINTSSFSLESGARLSKNKREIEVIKDSKVSSTEEFVIGFFCENPKAPTRCMIRNHGHLYLN